MTLDYPLTQSKMADRAGEIMIIDELGNPVDVATEETLAKLAGSAIGEYDYIALTYVAAGDGAGEIETATYKLGGVGGTTVATLTLAYNASDAITSVTKT